MTTQKTFLAALGLAALLSSSLALADHDHKGHKNGGPRQDVVALEQSKISAAQAIAIAEKDTNATADNLDLELHRGSAVYEIELIGSDGSRHFADISADDGKILRSGEKKRPPHMGMKDGNNPPPPPPAEAPANAPAAQ